MIGIFGPCALVVFWALAKTNCNLGVQYLKKSFTGWNVVFILVRDAPNVSLAEAFKCTKIYGSDL